MRHLAKQGGLLVGLTFLSARTFLFAHVNLNSEIAASFTPETMIGAHRHTPFSCLSATIRSTYVTRFAARRKKANKE